MECILSQATFQDAQTLVLSGLTSTAQSFATGGRTAVYPIQAFVDATPQSQFVASNGQWLSNPQTVHSLSPRNCFHHILFSFAFMCP